MTLIEKPEGNWPTDRRATAALPRPATPHLSALQRKPDNDVSAREGAWHRHAGDDWAAFEALPPAVRARLRAHAYDAWAVNALVMWRMFRRRRGDPARAERALLRYLDRCESMECDAFASSYRSAYGAALPHVAAGVAVLRDGVRSARRGETTAAMRGTGR